VPDLRNPKLLYLKGGLFLIGGLLSAAALLLEIFTLKNLVLLCLTIWCFSRAYYFAFYVIEHYVDPSYRFAGLTSFLRYLFNRPSPRRRRQRRR
jgi:hypothetical protein